MTSISFVLMLFEIPIIPGYAFLTYDPSDVIPLMTGLYAGIWYSIIIIALRNILHFLIKPDLLGHIMSFVASIAFVIPTILIYRNNHTKKGGILGLLCGIIFLSISMYILNYIVVPIFYGMHGKQLYAYLLYGVIPFNILKGFINSIVVLFFYKRFSGLFLKNIKK